MRRQLAAELGDRGVRVVTLRSGGVPESLPANTPGRERIVSGIAGATLLGRVATFDDIGDVARGLRSAQSMTAATVNVSAGALID